MSSDEETRASWLEASATVSLTAVENKQSQEALVHMAQRYQALSQEERPVIDAILVHQVLSQDENTRFDALALVDKFKIYSAEPALRQLEYQLQNESHPGAPYEWAKVNRILAKFSGENESGPPL